MPSTAHAFVASLLRRRMALEDITKQAEVIGYAEADVISAYDDLKLAQYDRSLAFDTFAHAC